MSWWSHHYNRPMKDPILLSYTIEELSYEYFNVIQRKKAEEERVEADSDKIEQEHQKEAEKWADEMEAEEEAAESVDPTTQPDNVKWMEEEIQRSKQEFGESFGDDLSLDFGK